jgi:hypothetical protein
MLRQFLYAAADTNGWRQPDRTYRVEDNAQVGLLDGEVKSI